MEIIYVQPHRTLHFRSLNPIVSHYGTTYTSTLRRNDDGTRFNLINIDAHTSTCWLLAWNCLNAHVTNCGSTWHKARGTMHIAEVIEIKRLTNNFPFVSPDSLFHIFYLRRPSTILIDSHIFLSSCSLSFFCFVLQLTRTTHIGHLPYAISIKLKQKIIFKWTKLKKWNAKIVNCNFKMGK